MHKSISQSKAIALFDFIFVGFLLSVILNMYDNDGYHLYQIILIAIFMVLYGPNRIANELYHFTKKYFILLGSFLIWIILAGTRGSTFFSGGSRIFSIYLLIFMGYFVSKRKSEQYINRVLLNIWLVLGVAALYGLFEHFTRNNPLMYCSERFTIYAQNFSRMTSAFVHPIPCATFILIFLILSVRLDLSLGVKITSVSLGVIALIFTFTRSAWFVFLLTLFIVYAREIRNFLSQAKLKKRTIYVVFFIFIGLLLCITVFTGRFNEMISLMSNRLFSKSLGTDMSYIWRISSIRIIAIESFKSGIVGAIFGNGFSSAARLLKNMNFGSMFSYNVATPDNAYISALYDFGIVGFILLFAFIKRLSSVIHKCTNKTYKTVLAIDVSLMLMAIFYEEFYWCNIAFVVFVWMGLVLGINERSR